MTDSLRSNSPSLLVFLCLMLPEAEKKSCNGLIPQSRICILWCWHVQNLAGHGSFLLFIHLSWIHDMLNAISTSPQLHSILHCFIKNCILLQWMHKISYFQSVCVTFLHTLLKFQLHKAKLCSQYTLKRVGTDFSLLGNFKWESQIHNQ